MPLIEGLRIQNYRSLRDIAMGKIGTDPALKEAAPLEPLTVVVGKNGVGKSTIFDAFGFLADCMETDIQKACRAKNRVNFDRLVSAGARDPIKLTLYYRESKQDRPITYEISIGKEHDNGPPLVLSERLRQRAKGQSWGQPRSFLHLEKGAGTVYIGDDALEGMKKYQKNQRRVKFSPHKLAIVSLAEEFSENPRIAKFKQFIQNWHLSYFTPDAARQTWQGGADSKLNLHGDNLGNFVEYIHQQHPVIFQGILQKIAAKIPGMGDIRPYRDEITHNLYLFFHDKGIAAPFIQNQMSDGTLKLFSYLLLMNDPSPAPFICIEEPENGLYHQTLEFLADEFREHATGAKNAPQIFVTTHQPYLLDAMDPQEVWVLQKGGDGFSTITRADHIPTVTELLNQGQPLGAIWYGNYLNDA